MLGGQLFLIALLVFFASVAAEGLMDLDVGGFGSMANSDGSADSSSN